MSKAKLDVALKCAGQIRTVTVKNSEDGWKELDKWLKKHAIKTAHACMEATNTYAEGIAAHL